jgi:RNA recognition motif-containing protein
MKTIYVGNLPFDVTEDDVRGLFAPYGEVATVSLVTDRDTGRPRGFGFVEMPPDAADQAIDALDGMEMGGRTLRVNEARDRGARPPRRQW